MVLEEVILEEISKVFFTKVWLDVPIAFGFAATASPYALTIDLLARVPFSIFFGRRLGHRVVSAPFGRSRESVLFVPFFIPESVVPATLSNLHRVFKVGGQSQVSDML